MQIPDWLAAAKEDAIRRGLPELAPLLDGLAVATTALREADDAERRRAEPVRRRDPRDADGG